MNDPPVAIDLFCGAGGFTQGLKNAGYEVCWAIDSDAAAVEAYQENHNHEVLPEDIRGTEPETDGPDIEPGELDLIAGGPPCPSFSMIGRSKLDSLEDRGASEDERNLLYRHFLRYVAYFEPRAFVMENVPGLLRDTAIVETGVIQQLLPVDPADESAEKRVGQEVPVPDIILDEMRSLGYHADWQRVDAADYGVPQHRERVFFIGVRDNDELPDLSRWATHREPRSDEETKMRVRSEPGAFTQTPQTSLTKEEALPPFEADRNPGEPYLTVADAILDLPPVSPDGEMPPVQATSYTLPPVSPYQQWLRDVPRDETWDEQELRNHSCRWHNHLDLSIYKLLGHGVGWNIGEVSQELQPYRDDVFRDKYKKQNPAKPASTILAHIQKDGHMFIHPTEARSLTVREAARLQSFRDRYWLPESRTKAYRLVGNAVPPRLGEAVGVAIRKGVLEET
ncbi:DNA cytosine methyltransferase [Halomarina oriensis]|uniref:DNA (cytosine-5-)-methyltransferase n=1 Tax=Halomarina oriensis TaxID=671145 RepID=A0A6B0GVS8_9EURY|nr:DNA cytosine methyltransferase [Halomarina oriensis]MWG36683.1 DNA (cytosine-5-)-methyltransferase [Halomarina oriensis]